MGSVLGVVEIVCGGVGLSLVFMGDESFDEELAWSLFFLYIM